MTTRPWQTALRADARLDRSPFPAASLTGRAPGEVLASRRFGPDRRYEAQQIATRFGAPAIFILDHAQADPQVEGMPKVVGQLSEDEWAQELRA